VRLAGCQEKKERKKKKERKRKKEKLLLLPIIYALTIINFIRYLNFFFAVKKKKAEWFSISISISTKKKWKNLLLQTLLYSPRFKLIT
jgi:hypothetical protein